MSVLYGSLYPESISGIAIIAACSVYYKGWPFPSDWGVRFFYHFCRTISRFNGTFPGEKSGFGGREAKTIMMDWSHQGITGHYCL